MKTTAILALAGLVPAIEGTINGTPATMLVDTGADSAYLTMTAALRRNLTLQISRERLVGVGGFSRLYTTRLEELSVGPGTWNKAGAYSRQARPG